MICKLPTPAANKRNEICIILIVLQKNNKAKNFFDFCCTRITYGFDYIIKLHVIRLTAFTLINVFTTFLLSPSGMLVCKLTANNMFRFFAKCQEREKKSTHSFGVFITFLHRRMHVTIKNIYKNNRSGRSMVVVQPIFCSDTHIYKNVNKISIEIMNGLVDSRTTKKPTACAIELKCAT